MTSSTAEREPAVERARATLRTHCVGAGLLLLGGLLMLAATAARWGLDCLPGSLTSPECLQRGKPEYSYVVVWPMTHQGVPSGVLMGLAMACCAVAIVLLSRKRGRATEVVGVLIGALIVGAALYTFFAVATAGPVLSHPRSAVGEWYRWNVLASALPVLGLFAIAADFVMSRAEPDDPAEKEHKRWRLRMWIWLMLANPIVAYAVADAVSLGRIRGLVPWTEAVTALVVLAAGVTALRSCLLRRAETGRAAGAG